MSDELDIEELLDSEEDESLPSDGLDEVESRPLNDDELQSLARRLVELRTRRDETKLAFDNAKKEFEAFQAELLERVNNSPVKGSRTVYLGDDLGEVRLTPKRTKYGRVLDRDKAVEWMKEREKLDEYMKDDFRMGRLHELVREYIEQKKPLPPGIDFYTKEYFQVTFKD